MLEKDKADKQLIIPVADHFIADQFKGWEYGFAIEFAEVVLGRLKLQSKNPCKKVKDVLGRDYTL